MTCDDEVPIEPVGRLEIVAIGGRHLAGRLVVGNAAKACSHRWECDHVDLPLVRNVMRLDSEKNAPGACRQPGVFILRQRLQLDRLDFGDEPAGVARKERGHDLNTASLKPPMFRMSARSGAWLVE